MRLNTNKEYLKGKNGFIFDLDGTLVDSMVHWRSFDWENTTIEEAYSVMKVHYQNDIPIKRDSFDALKNFNKLGIKCCIATATRTDICYPCIDRVGFLPYIEFILCCKDVNAGKDRPDIYLEAAHKLGLKISETVIFEDQLYAAITAKKAGFTVVAIHDNVSVNDADKLKKVADDYIYSYSELLED